MMTFFKKSETSGTKGTERCLSCVNRRMIFRLFLTDKRETPTFDYPEEYFKSFTNFRFLMTGTRVLCVFFFFTVLYYRKFLCYSPFLN